MHRENDTVAFAEKDDSFDSYRPSTHTGQKAKIVYVHHGRVIGGGASVSLINTLRWMKKHTRYDIKLWCPYGVVNRHIEEKLGIPTFRMPNPLKTLGKVLIGWAYWHRLRTFRALMRELFQLPSNVIAQLHYLYMEQPDLIHLNSSILISTAIAARILKIPIVWHVREVNLGSRSNPRRRFMGWLIRRLADIVITISPVEAESIDGADVDKVKVVYNYIDFREFDSIKFNKDEIKRKLKIDKPWKRLITLGGSTNFRKGVVPLLQAMKYTSSDVSLLVVGPNHKEPCLSLMQRFYRDVVHGIEDFFVTFGITDAPYRNYDYRVSKTFRKIREKIDTDRIVWVGEVTDVAPYLAISDVLVFAGMTPHFPRPVFEAWAMKKPVIAFDVDGIKQNIENDVDGLLIKKNNSKLLGMAADDLLKNRTRCEKMGEMGWRKANNLFRTEKNMKKIMGIYEELLCQDDK